MTETDHEELIGSVAAMLSHRFGSLGVGPVSGDARDIATWLLHAGYLATDDDGCGWRQRYEDLRAERDELHWVNEFLATFRRDHEGVWCKNRHHTRIADLLGDPNDEDWRCAHCEARATPPQQDADPGLTSQAHVFVDGREVAGEVVETLAQEWLSIPIPPEAETLHRMAEAIHAVDDAHCDADALARGMYCDECIAKARAALRALPGEVGSDG